MTRILLIRHGQSANNALPETDRVSDPDLTDLGKTQAVQLAQHLAGKSRITHLYSSAFRRALETVRPVATAMKLPVQIRADIFEKGGCYSGHDGTTKRGEPGLTASDLRQEFPQWEVDSRISDGGWWGKDYETLEQAKLRAAHVATWIQKEICPQDGVHAFVIHADFKALLLDHFLHTPPDSYVPLYNTGVTEFEWSDRGNWKLQYYNQTLHLNEQQRSN